jgi:pimeloyl-ACP methyl ester carboxylesterase
MVHRPAPPSARGFVLVHGGAHGPWCWDKLVPLLNHPAAAIELPGRTAASDVSPRPLRLADYSNAVVDGVDAAGFDEVVLVGHSLGGLTVTAAAGLLGERVKHVVYVAAMVAGQTGAPIDLLPQPLRAVVRRRLARLGGGSGGYLELPAWVVRRYFCNGLDDADTRTVQGLVCPEPTAPLLERVQRSTLPAHLPRTYIGFRSDRAIPHFMQRRFASRIGTSPVRLDGGHDGMIGNAAGLAGLLNKIAAMSLGPAASTDGGQATLRPGTSSRRY